MCCVGTKTCTESNRAAKTLLFRSSFPLSTPRPTSHPLIDRKTLCAAAFNKTFVRVQLFVHELLGRKCNEHRALLPLVALSTVGHRTVHNGAGAPLHHNNEPSCSTARCSEPMQARSAWSACNRCFLRCATMFICRLGWSRSKSAQNGYKKSGASRCNKLSEWDMEGRGWLVKAAIKMGFFSRNTARILRKQARCLPSYFTLNDEGR